MLTKEIIRNFKRENQLDLKLKATWSRLPKVYQDILLDSNITNSDETRAQRELESMGVLKLKIFNDKKVILTSNPEKLLNKFLKAVDINIYNHFKRNRGKLIQKEAIAKIVWGNNYLDKYSDWAIDQKISRFRKKLLKVGIDPANLITVKGKGYKWN